MSAPATDRQLAYLRKLGADAPAGVLDELLAATGARVANPWGFTTRPLTKTEASGIIDQLIRESGREPAPYVPRRRGSYRGGGRRPFRVSYRCTHEDYPCCGCDADSRGAYGSSRD